MESRAITVTLPKNPLIAIRVIPGHFTTSNSHVSHYLDMSSMKSNASVAKKVAGELAIPYMTSTLVDTIVCMEETEVIGAYLAEELSQAATSAMNSGSEIYVVKPMSNVSGKLIFQNNVQEMIMNKNVILLVASVSSGRTIDSALECLNYYGGKLAGISALFSALPEDMDHQFHTLFTQDDINGYQFFSSGECQMCKKGLKLDAIVNSEGYIRI